MDSWRRKYGYRRSPRRYRDGGGGGFQFGGMHIGIGGAIILLILSIVFKTNFFALLSGGGGAHGSVIGQRSKSPARHVPARSSGKAAGAVRVFRSGRHPENLGHYLPQQENKRTGTPSWCYFAMPFNRAAEVRKRPPGRFIARKTKKFTSTWVFTMS